MFIFIFDNILRKYLYIQYFTNIEILLINIFLLINKYILFINKFFFQ